MSRHHVEDAMLVQGDLPRFENLTYRQIDRWARTGLIRPARDARGSGTRRKWSPRDVARLCVLDRLAVNLTLTQPSGFPPAWVKAIWDALEHDWPPVIHIDPATGGPPGWSQPTRATLVVTIDILLAPPGLHGEK